MKDFHHFYYLTLIFGLAPYTMYAKSKKLGCVCLKIIPTFYMLTLYIFFVLSFFWQKKKYSEISGAANLIQVLHDTTI